MAEPCAHPWYSPNEDDTAAVCDVCDAVVEPDPDAESTFACPRCDSRQTCLFEGGIRTCLDCDCVW